MRRVSNNTGRAAAFAASMLLALTLGLTGCSDDGAGTRDDSGSGSGSVSGSGSASGVETDSASE